MSLDNEPLCGDGPDNRYCPVYWTKSAECEDLRKLAAQMLATFEFHYTNTYRAEVKPKTIGEWRHMLGITEPQPIQQTVTGQENGQ